MQDTFILGPLKRPGKTHTALLSFDIQNQVDISSSNDEMVAQYKTNVFGTLNTARAFLPHFRAKRSGTIVFVGSMVAWDGVPIVGTYCSSKAALHCKI